MGVKKFSQPFRFEEVFQNHLLSLLFLRPPRHRVACDLIPLAVLKPFKDNLTDGITVVACDLIPLAVLKLPDTVTLIIDSIRSRM